MHQTTQKRPLAKAKPARIASSEFSGHSSPFQSRSGYVPPLSAKRAQKMTLMKMVLVSTALHLSRSPESKHLTSFVPRSDPRKPDQLKLSKLILANGTPSPCKEMGTARPHNSYSVATVPRAR